MCSSGAAVQLVEWTRRRDAKLSGRQVCRGHGELQRSRERGVRAQHDQATAAKGGQRRCTEMAMLGGIAGIDSGDAARTGEGELKLRIRGGHDGAVVVHHRHLHEIK